MQRDAVLRGQPGQHPHRDVEIVTGVRQRAQRLVQRAEEVVPVDEHDAARADGAHGLRPVVDEVLLGLQPELPDAQVHDLGALPDQRAPDEACAADDQHPPVRRPVVHQRRPRLAALVRR